MGLGRGNGRNVNVSDGNRRSNIVEKDVEEPGRSTSSLPALQVGENGISQRHESSKSRGSDNGFANQTITFPVPDFIRESNHEHVVSMMQSPPTQVMERSRGGGAGYDPLRIPSAIFETNKTTSPVDWSIASNDSLFSLQLGNSFSRERKPAEVELQDATVPGQDATVPGQAATVLIVAVRAATVGIVTPKDCVRAGVVILPPLVLHVTLAVVLRVTLVVALRVTLVVALRVAHLLVVLRVVHVHVTLAVVLHVTHLAVVPVAHHAAAHVARLSVVRVIYVVVLTVTHVVVLIVTHVAVLSVINRVVFLLLHVAHVFVLRVALVVLVRFTLLVVFHVLLLAFLHVILVTALRVINRGVVLLVFAIVVFVLAVAVVVVVE
ncbi:hypothetical protein GH714_028790 [Hevea brasiliensis]|uniref:Uncharacterized protein n=1 Tax=Hevea brasiliensis TaxID=3981 RepID=A0A6A6NKU3_HEVBR|nr:hypothetical protein GH714_028790 [Hevea brasiliensis]